MNYHAHIYYDKSTRRIAEDIQQLMIKNFPECRVSHLVDYAVGPHLAPMFQASFGEQLLSPVIECLSPYKAQVSIMIHPLGRQHLRRYLFLGV